jgi:hypothetical protein
MKRARDGRRVVDQSDERGDMCRAVIAEYLRTEWLLDLKREEPE